MYFQIILPHVLSLDSLQTTDKTINNYSVTTLGNIHYADSYKEQN